MIGMDRRTGRSLSGEAHVAQSQADILTTPLGTRPMREEYGSLLPELLDQPDTPANRARVYAATVMALRRWEPRRRIRQVRLTARPAERGAFDLVTISERTDPAGRVRTETVSTLITRRSS